LGEDLQMEGGLQQEAPNKMLLLLLLLMMMMMMRMRMRMRMRMMMMMLGGHLQMQQEAVERRCVGDR